MWDVRCEWHINGILTKETMYTASNRYKTHKKIKYFNRMQSNRKSQVSTPDWKRKKNTKKQNESKEHSTANSFGSFAHCIEVAEVNEHSC